ncbi:MAG: starvation-sensing protein RspA, partial [Vicinamibacteraceae bacterium]
MQRREVLRGLTATTLTGAGLLSARSPVAEVWAQEKPTSLRGMPTPTITDIQTILTAPNGIRLVVVKVLTSEPGLYGWGCATFTQRALVVKTAID